jgi:hypothetical protein
MDFPSQVSIVQLPAKTATNLKTIYASTGLEMIASTVIKMISRIQKNQIMLKLDIQLIALIAITPMHCRGVEQLRIIHFSH